MAGLWMHTSEYQWLHEFITKLRARAVREMEVGVDMERYAEIRGYIEACDHILDAPNRYASEKASEYRNQEQVRANAAG